jgi:hypothetical protein
MSQLRLPVCLCLIGLVLAAAGCLKWEPRNTDGVTIVNDSSETVTVVVLFPEPARERELTVYRPGESSVETGMINWETGCTRVAMVARTEDGREIDRQRAPICVDEEWRIED